MAEQEHASVATPPPLPASVTRRRRKTRTGEVISDRMNKTIVVRTVTRSFGCMIATKLVRPTPPAAGTAAAAVAAAAGASGTGAA